MLVITHDNYIIGKHCLFRPVVKSRVAGRHIIVHGKHQVVILAFQGKLPHKLDVGIPYLAA